MKTLLTIAAAPLLTASLLVAAPAVADAPAVTAADLPTAKQFRSVYPGTKASLYMNERNVSTSLVKSCTRVTPIRARKSRIAGITGPSAKAPVVYVVVSEMKTVKAARQVMAGQRRAITCGTVSTDGSVAESRAIRTPELGQERVGLTATYTLDGQGSPSHTSEFYFRDGKRVVEIATFTSGKPDHAKARRLAKIAYRVSR